MHRAVGPILLAALLFLTAPGRAAAQDTGTIRGRLADTTGTPIGQATIVVEGTTLRGRSDEQGSYRIAGVPAGTHTVRAQRIGYTAPPARVTVQAGAEATQNFTMTPVAAGLAAVQVVTGSRALHTAAEELAVPVDVLTAEQITTTGSTETAAILAQLSPSVNFPRQAVSDASDIVRPYTMRGLSPDHSLVLLNGKRRHHAALIHYYGAGMGAGSSGIDMNAIPSSAIERMEVLRDGAAAQYGSDAIAGVVNVILKEGAFAPTITVNGGQYMTRGAPLESGTTTDGQTFNIGGGWGFNLGRGSVGLFAEYRDRNGTNRAGADELDQLAPGDADEVDDFGRIIRKNNNIDQPTHHWGDGEEQALMTFVNAKFPLDAAGNHGLYAFGGLSSREGTGFGYFRQAMSERNWTQIYPQGYLPRFAPDVLDVSAAGGVRGAVSGWYYDVGASHGHNGFEFNLENTLNASLGPCLQTACAPGLDNTLGTADDPGIPNKTAFFAGKLQLYETVLSVDASRAFEVGLRSPLNVAIGAAYRRDEYSITAGEPGSYIQGGYRDPATGDLLPAGSQVFPGFRPADATDADRSNVGLYAELESDIAPKLLANVAARFEDYSDFGSKVTGKLALRLQPTQQVTLRGAVSTGFRAPSLAQTHYSSVSTNFAPDASGQPVPFETGIFPVHSAEARALGAEPLRPETSRNYSAGLALSPADRLNFTADVYRIDMDDRILLTTYLGGPDVEAILAAANSRATTAQYFTNAISTRTSGVDLTANYEFGLGAGMMNLSADYGYLRTKIVGEIDTPAVLENIGVELFDEFGEGGLLALTKERPRWRAGATARYARNTLHGLIRASYFGQYTSALYSYSAADVQTYGSKGLWDAELGYSVFGTQRISLGVKNIFDTYPDKMSPNNSFKMFIYPPASPFGYNGRFIYARMELTLGR